MIYDLSYFGLCMLLGVASIGLAINFAAAMSAMSRNPSQSKSVQTLCLIGAAFIELLVFIGTVINFIK